MKTKKTISSKSKAWEILIGQRIRCWRRARNMTQKQLAKSIGISSQQLWKHERGIGNIHLNRLKTIAETLKIPLVELIADDVAEITDPKKTSLEKEDAILITGAFLNIKNSVLREKLLFFVQSLEGQ